MPYDRKSTRLNSSHGSISYAVFCLKKKKETRSRARGGLHVSRAREPGGTLCPPEPRLLGDRRVRAPVGRSCGGGRVFFFNDTATTEIYTLSLHDALPI